jgi:hypothetical protein
MFPREWIPGDVMGGATSLTDRVVLVHSIDLRDGHFWLDAAVLLRGRQPGWYQTRRPPDPQRIRRRMGRSGGGASAGRHLIFVDRGDRAVWVDDDLQIPLGEFNVVLLDGADEPAELPIVCDKFAIAADLGAAPPTMLPSTQTPAVKTLTATTERVDFGAAPPSASSSPQTITGSIVAAAIELSRRVEESAHVREFLRS